MKRALLLAFLALLVVPGAWAHAEPLEASPGWNERLEESPSEAVVVFTEPVFPDGSWIRVRNLDGERVDLDDLRITPGQNPVMRVTLPPLDDGAYLIRWQTYSQTDGHTVGGAIGFSIGAFAPPESTGINDDARPWSMLARALTYLGYTAAIGAMAFDWGVLRQPVTASSRRLDLAIMGGAGVHWLGVGILLLDTAAGTGLSLGDFVAGSGGRSLLVRWLVATGLAGLALLWLRGPVRPRVRYPLLAAFWLLAIALGSQYGHAMGAAAWMVQVLHGLAIASWVGGLAFLVHAVWTGTDPDVLGRRFGTLAMAATALMAATGIYLSAVILGPAFVDPNTAFTGGWRAILSSKILLAIAMIGLAAVNRFLVLGASPTAQKFRASVGLTARSGLQRLAGAEAVLGVVTIVLAGVLMSLAAPTEGLQSEATAFSQTATGFDFESVLEITPEPTAAEFHLVRLYLEDFTGEPLRENSCAEGRTDCVSMAWYPDADGPEAAQSSTGVPDGDGWWVFENLLFAAPGNHTMVAEASSQYAFKDALQFQFLVLQSA